MYDDISEPREKAANRREHCYYDAAPRTTSDSSNLYDSLIHVKPALNSYIDVVGDGEMRTTDGNQTSSIMQIYLKS
jgi:hypothetical protein